MVDREIECPGCRTLLRIPASLESAKVQCAFCRTAIDISGQGRVTVTEDLVAGWLLGRGGEEELEVLKARSQSDGQPATEMQSSDEQAPAAQAHEPSDAVRLVNLDHKSAEFEFPGERLLPLEFRGAISRRCICCGARNRLTAHPVIFAIRIADRGGLDGEKAPNGSPLKADELGHLTGPELLARMPPVRNVPFPGNLPFPYYVCDHCHPHGAVAGQICLHEQTGRSICRLMLANLTVAAEFVAAVEGTSCEDYQRLAEALAAHEVDPWGSLPVDVRHRIEQWFRGHPGESFVAFIPDRDFARSEVGMAGLVISSRRVIYHRPPRHRETTIDDTIQVRLLTRGAKQVIQLASPGLKEVSMASDPACIRELRHAFRMAGMHAQWT